VPTPPQLFGLFGFALGLLFGSFLNVCISRLPAHRSVVTPRSHCNSCGHTIRWFDNIPVLSWIALHGHCRDCDAQIPGRYPAVELLTGFWFFSFFSGTYYIFTGTANTELPLWIWWGQHWTILLSQFILGFLLIGLMVMDWQTHRLPDAFTLTGIIVGFALTCVQSLFLSSFNKHAALSLSLHRIAGIAAAALLLLAIRWIYQAVRKREGMGLGDVKMLAMIAAFLGLSQTLLALFAAVLTASLFGIIQLARSRAHAATRLPFGSFLAAGGLFSALFGSQIVDWYVTLLR
jgi:leader peptidase (prepilin peptidase)/N-methyltransferase